MSHALRVLHLRLSLCVAFLFASGGMNAAFTVVVTNTDVYPATLEMSTFTDEGDEEEPLYEFEYQTGQVPGKTTKTFTFTTIPGAEHGLIVNQWRGVGSSLVGQSFLGTGATYIEIYNDMGLGPNDAIPLSLAAGQGAPLLDTRKTVWLGTDTTLTADLFREGVDKIVGFDGQLIAAVENSGGMTLTEFGTTYTEGANERLAGSLAANLDFDGSHPTEAEAFQAAASSVGDAAALEQTALYPTAPTETGYEIGTGTDATSLLAVTMPAAFGGATFDFNPFTGERMGPVTSWFKYALEWLTLVLLGVYVNKEMATYARALGGVQQAKGNTYAGTGGQITALVAAGIMSAIIVVFVTALVAWSFGAISMLGLVTSVSVNPLLGLAGGALWMMLQCFPVETIIAALLARLTFPLYAQTLYVGCVASIRFVVP